MSSGLKNLFAPKNDNPVQALAESAEADQHLGFELGENPTDPPMPGIALRRSVGVEDKAFFENPHAMLTFGDDIEAAAYRRVLDFGCGCGRIARQMMLQAEGVPEFYMGLDLYKPSILWCSNYLTSYSSQFQFQHLNALNIGLNPTGVPQAPFDIAQTFTLVNSHSVFTHILERDLSFYFDECVSRLEDGGVLRATWFLFNKEIYPMMQDFQNCLYINADDLSNATIYDFELVKAMYRQAGLQIYKIYRPYIRGHQWLIYARKADGPSVDFPEDDGPLGLTRPPVSQ
jgi:SAM-dependent methyltransferase